MGHRAAPFQQVIAAHPKAPHLRMLPQDVTTDGPSKLPYRNYAAIIKEIFTEFSEFSPSQVQ